MREAERTGEGRYIVVNGRRWRASDPSIPDDLRQYLVNELMAARRAVKAARASKAHLAAARGRVQDAKVALGERGAKWWEESTEQDLDKRIECTLRALIRTREIPKTICPSEVARTIGGANWPDLIPNVHQVARTLLADGRLEMTQNGAVVVDPTSTTGAIRYRRGATLD